MRIFKLITIFVFVVWAFAHCNSETNSDSERIESIKLPEVSKTSEITCPYCGHKKVESLPTEVCQIKYNCENCKKTILPKDGDCCVYCSYGTHKCPSMQKD